MLEREYTSGQLPAIDVCSELISSTGRYQISVDRDRYRELLISVGTPDWAVARSKLFIRDGEDELTQGKCNPGLMEVYVYVGPLWNVHMDASATYATEEESLVVMNFLLNSTLLHEAKHLGDSWVGRFKFPVFRNYRVERSARQFAQKQSRSWQDLIKVEPFLVNR